MKHNLEEGKEPITSGIEPKDGEGEELTRLKREIVAYEKRLKIALGQLAEKENTLYHLLESLNDTKKVNKELILQISKMDGENKTRQG